MECQECQKRPATLHFRQLINGNKTKIHICEACAQEKGYFMHQQDEGYSLHNLLSSLFNFDYGQLDSSTEETFNYTDDLRCPKCNLTLSEFKRTGKFGCAQCYETFSVRLDPIFRRVHSGNTKHYGKIPKRMGGDLHIKKKLKAYQDKLEQLIKDEAFEQAAIVRDQIKELKLKSNNSVAGEEE